jgi:DNA-binding transcriptional regulator YdaS (Cro superfamily)
MWKKRSSVPAEWCPAIERATRSVATEKGDASLIVTCEELRPDVPWSVLREQSVPEAEAPAAQQPQEEAAPAAAESRDDAAARELERALAIRERARQQRRTDHPGAVNLEAKPRA